MTMCSSYSLAKCLVLVHVLVTQFLFIRRVSSLNLTNAYLNHKCRVSEGKYQPGSKYEEGFNFLIRSISTNDFSSNFDHISNDETPPNSVTIIFQCRGDSYGSNCRSCFATAVAGLRRRCERNKGGIIWYDQCFLDVSSINRRSPRKIDYENNFSVYNPNNVSGDTKLFKKEMEDFLYKLIVKASRLPDKDGVLINYYAAEEKRLKTIKVYAMMQCAGDIANCSDCLKWSVMELFKCCIGRQGARVLSTTCNLRYEFYPFLRINR